MNLDKIPELLYMPAPKCIHDQITFSTEADIYLEKFIKIQSHPNRNEFLLNVNMLINQLSESLSINNLNENCYTTTQQRLSDEYFFVKRVTNNLDLRMIYNACIIIRDIIQNNETDNLIDSHEMDVIFCSMKKLLTYIKQVENYEN